MAGFVGAVLTGIYITALAVALMFALHRYVQLYLYYRHRRNAPRPRARFQELPYVTVQVPTYNEPNVVGRAIESACAINYPHDKLQIQILDDSTDNTTSIARRTAKKMRAQGLDIKVIHRTERAGFKAGALAHGMRTVKGEFVLILDADFVPHERILDESIHYFTDPSVAMVQTRWDHANRSENLLTRIQAILLDGHFVIEQVARSRSGRLIAFNGSAGVWRRAVIEKVGNWRSGCLAEDLDLSFRAQLRGAKFVFLSEPASCGELPTDMQAFKAQQFRWTKGGVQTALQMLPEVLRSGLARRVKIEAVFHLMSFVVYVCMLLVALLIYPVVRMHLAARPGGIGNGGLWLLINTTLVLLGTMPVCAFYMASQARTRPGRRWETIFMLPWLMGVGIGICVSNVKAVLEGICRRESPFVRTPKQGGQKGSAAGDNGGAAAKSRLLAYTELAIGLYLLGCTVHSMAGIGTAFTTPFLAMFSFGFLYVGAESLKTSVRISPGAAPLKHWESILEILKHPLVALVLGGLVVSIVASYTNQRLTYRKALREHRQTLVAKTEVQHAEVEASISGVQTRLELFHKGNRRRLGDGARVLTAEEIRQRQADASVDVKDRYAHFDNHAWHWYWGLCQEARDLEYSERNLSTLHEYFTAYQKSLIRSTKALETFWTRSLRDRYDPDDARLDDIMANTRKQLDVEAEIRRHYLERVVSIMRGGAW